MQGEVRKIYQTGNCVIMVNITWSMILESGKCLVNVLQNGFISYSVEEVTQDKEKNKKKTFDFLPRNDELCVN